MWSLPTEGQDWTPITCTSVSGGFDPDHSNPFQLLTALVYRGYKRRVSHLNIPELALMTGNNKFISFRADFFYVSDHGSIETWINNRGSGKTILSHADTWPYE